MRFRTTLILLVVLCALCIGYYLMLLSEEKAREEAREVKRAFGFAPEDFRTISIQQEDRKATVGVRDENGMWRIVEPYPLKAYQKLWDRVAKHLADLSKERIIEETPKDLGRYELDYPRLVIVAETGAGEGLKATFGMVGPTQRNRYAQLNDGPIVLVDENTYFELDRGLDLLRYFYLFDPGEEGIARLEFAWIWPEKEQPALADASASEPAPGEESVRVVLEKDVDAAWRMRAPVEGPADGEAVGRWIGELQAETCKDFVDEPENLADYGLEPARARITVWTGHDGEPQTVFFGDLDREGPQARMFAKRADGPAVFTVRAALATSFPAAPDAFRERRLLTHAASSITAIHYSSKGTRFALRKDPQAGWRISEPAHEDTDQVAVSSFIASLSRFQGVRFADPDEGDFGFENPAAVIELAFEGVEKPGKIRVGAKTADGDAYYVTQDIGYSVVLEPQLAEMLIDVNLFTFRDKTLIGFDKKEAVRVALKLDGVSYVFERLGGQWRITSPPDKRWESPTDMEALLDAFNPLAAVGLESPERPSDLSPYGLDEPVLELTVTLEPVHEPGQPRGEQTTLPAIKVGALSEGRPRERYAIIEGRPEVFRIRQARLDDARQALKGIRDK